MPTSDEILEFIRDFQGKVTKREIARSFNIKGPDKVQLKKLLREMTADGLIAQDQHKALRPADRLPAVQVVEFAGLDKHGEPLVKPVNMEGKPPTIHLAENKKKRGKSVKGNAPAMGRGDRALVRLTDLGDNRYRADLIKMLPSGPASVLGVFHGGPNGGNIHPVDKKNRDEYFVDKDHIYKAKDGDLVLAEPLKRGRRHYGPKMARVKEIIGDVSSARSISLIAIHAHNIPNEFPDDVVTAAKAAKMVELGNREDLRDIPLITIDPVDARDHDDAIWAESDPDPKNKGGWHVIVAIADVAHYVQPGSALDKEAYKRGNSCYFPDRVVPMLPEELSAGLCSLQPDKDRACMALHMWFDKGGKKLAHRFARGLMRSHGNISYQMAQHALDGTPDDVTEPLLECTLKPLFGAYEALMKARAKRAPLELDLPERKIEIGEDGHVKSIALRERTDSHKIVEEMMIMSNVCAAEELEKHNAPVMYRVHDEPPMDKMEALRDFLKTMDLTITKGAVLQPRLFNGVLSAVHETPQEHLVNEVILRSQTQAFYGPENLGHFGLALPRYAHFTSPIRRYSDLIVHRSLIRSLGFGKDGLTLEESHAMEQIGEHISQTERRAMTAERDSTDRYLASYLSDHVGDEFIGRISGVNRFGLFVTIEPSGGDGLIPISAIGPDYYFHDEAEHALKGERFGQVFKLGDKVDVRLLEANKFTGGLRLELITDDELPDFIKRKPGRGGKGRTGGKKRKPGTNEPRNRPSGGKKRGRRR